MAFAIVLLLAFLPCTAAVRVDIENGVLDTMIVGVEDQGNVDQHKVNATQMTNAEDASSKKSSDQEPKTDITVCCIDPQTGHTKAKSNKDGKCDNTGVFSTTHTKRIPHRCCSGDNIFPSLSNAWMLNGSHSTAVELNKRFCSWIYHCSYSDVQQDVDHPTLLPCLCDKIKAKFTQPPKKTLPAGSREWEEQQDNPHRFFLTATAEEELNKASDGRIKRIFAAAEKQLNEDWSFAIGLAAAGSHI